MNLAPIVHPCVTQKRAWRQHHARLRMLIVVGIGIVWFLVGGEAGGKLHQVHAQRSSPSPPSPVSLTVVNVGYDGYYRNGRWFPITVELRNDGPDVHATLTWRFPGDPNQVPGGENQRFRRETELPRGARKRLTWYAYTASTTRIGEVSLSLTGQPPLREHRRQVTIEPIEQGWFAVGVLSNNATLLNNLLAMNIPNTWRTTVLHLAPEHLPMVAQAMLGIDVLFLHGTAANRLSAEQYDALEEWIWLGGQLVVSGGSNTELSSERLATLLPVTVHQLEAQVSLEPLRQLVAAKTGATVAGKTDGPGEANTNNFGTGEDLPSATTMHRVTLKETAFAFDTEQLITARQWGYGRVLFTRFDLNTLRSWSEEANLWQHILTKEHPLNPYEHLNLWGTVKSPVFDTLPFGILLLFIAGYIIVIGPLNFLLLRRWQRVDWTWLTTPAIAMVFIVGTYGMGLLWRGVRTLVLQVSVVHAEEGQSTGIEVAYCGIFSPHRAKYSLILPGQVLIHPESPYSYSVASTDQAIVWDDTSSRVQDMLIDIGSTRTIIVEQRVSHTLSVSSSLRWSVSQDGTTYIVGHIENPGMHPLSESILVYGSRARQIGTINPGETLAVSLGPDDEGFPYEISGMSDDDEIFSRPTLISQVFPPAMADTMLVPTPAPVAGPYAPPAVPPPTASMPMRRRPYLLAWGDQPLTTPQIHGEKVFQRQRSLVLYVILLDPIEMPPDSAGTPRD